MEVKNIGFKYRLDPTEKQKEFIEGQINFTRVMYNCMLNETFQIIKNNSSLSKEDRPKFKIPSYGKYSQMYDWSKPYIRSCLDYEQRSLSEAVFRWFDILKSGSINPKTGKFDPDYGKPRFKKRRDKNSFRLRARDVVLLDDNTITIPKIDEPFKIIKHRPIPENLIKYGTITIKRESSYKYYVVFTLEVEDYPEIENVDHTSNKIIAIDLGIRNRMVYETDDGKIGCFPNPKNYKKYNDRLVFYSKKASRQQNGSNRQKITYLKKAKLEEQLKNARNYLLNNISTDLIRKYDTIILEDLNVQDIVQQTNKTFKNVSAKAKHNINRATYDVGWYMFTQMLLYKGAWNNRNVYLIDTKNKTVQTCSNCGFINKEMVDVNIRDFDCPECGSHFDRCENACHNILKLYRQGKIKNYIK